MSKSFTIRDAVQIPMRDNTRLTADIWLPDGDGPWPVLLQRTPYRRETPFGSQHISALEFQSALRRGYGVMVQDTRGRYASGGDFDPFVHEGKDGADTVAWLRAQDFCDGRVAMFGGSYVGATQVLAAAEHPDGLVAISPHLTTARHGNTWMYRGGAVELGFLLLWIIEALALPDLERRLPKLESEVSARLQLFLSVLMTNPKAAFERLPVIEDDLVALAPYAAKWFDDAHAASAADDPERRAEIMDSPVAMLVSGGWNDIFIEGTIELFSIARARHADAEHVTDRLIIGPWSHGNPSDWQGNLWHGYAASTVALPDAQLSFFDAVMKGRQPDSAVVHYFRTGSNTWHDAPDWPLPGTTEMTFHLHDNRLSTDEPDTSWSRTYVSDPLEPVPTTGGATFLPGLLLGRNSGPMDQSAVEARSDVLTFTSGILTGALDITGLVTAQLCVQSDAPTCDWTARLCEVDEDGHSLGLVDGILRWQNSGGPAATEVATIHLGHISHLVKEGHRLRLQIASSNFPRFDRNPQSGAPPSRATASEFQTARQTIAGGPLFQSKLILPLVGARYDLNEFRV